IGSEPGASPVAQGRAEDGQRRGALPPAAPEPVRVGARQTNTAYRAQLTERLEQMLIAMLAAMLKLPVHRVERDIPLEQYGIESVAMMKLTGDLESRLGPLSKTLFFEYPTVEALAAHLADNLPPDRLAAIIAVPPDPISDTILTQQPAVASAAGIQRADSNTPSSVAAATAKAEPAAMLPPEPSAIPGGTGSDIAVIGMAGRFPMAADIEEFWANLAQGRDCISEIPAERWDHARYFDPNRNRPDKTYCKWGGFIADVDQF